MARRFTRLGDSRIVYDLSLVNQIEEALFDQAAWPNAPTAPGYSGGRGETLFIGTDQDKWVLRHYHRGGLTGRWLDDSFLWLGDSRTRPFMEWRLLERLVAMSLPVPRPVAGRFVRRGLLYTADLITVRIPDVVPLSTRWDAGPLEPETWRSIGELVGRFHGKRVYHADLTAHNIQINTGDELFLLDFDRGQIMPGAGSWSERNLNRLQRSLRKISKEGNREFSDVQWNGVLDGYRRALGG